MYPRINLKKKPIGYTAQEMQRIKQEIDVERQKQLCTKNLKAYKIQSLEDQYSELANTRSNANSPLTKPGQFLTSKRAHRREKSVNEVNTDSNSDYLLLKPANHLRHSSDPIQNKAITSKIQELAGNNKKEFSKSTRRRFLPKININKSLELISLEEQRSFHKPPTFFRVKLSSLV